jgi:hypothetical protein
LTGLSAQRRRVCKVLFLSAERAERKKQHPLGNGLIFELDLMALIKVIKFLPRSGCPPQADSFVGISATNENNLNLCELCASSEAGGKKI